MSSHGSSTDVSSNGSRDVSTTLNDFNAPYRFMNYVFTSRGRRTSKMIYTTDEEQYYVFNSKNKDSDAYQCVDCKSRVHLRKDEQLIQKQRFYGHKCPKKGLEFSENTVLNEIKQKCGDISTLMNEKKQSVRDIFYSVISKYPTAKLNFHEKERGLQMIRSAKLPKNPNNINEIEKIFDKEEIRNLLGKSKTNGVFYDGVLEGDGYSACFFSSKDSIEVLEEYVPYGEREIMMDGTFDVVPLGSFNQLLVIYGVYMGKVCLSSFFLLHS